MTATPSGWRPGRARPTARALGDDLRCLLNEWDPIGVADEVRDEYDCMLGPLLQRLRGGAGPLEIGEFLRDELEDHFGLDPVLSDPAAMAARVMRWWAAAGEGDDTGSGGTRLRRAVRGWWRAAPHGRRLLRGEPPGILD